MSTSAVGSPSGRPVVLDNTVLSNFARVGKTDLVAELWGNAAFTTPEVMNEYARGVKKKLFPPDAWIELSIAEPSAEEMAFYQTLPSSLGVGEKSCISIAHHRRMVLATDDLDARKAAIKLDLATTGTIGILVLCIRQGLLSLDQGDEVLDLMIDRNYHSPVKDLAQLL